MNDLQLAIDETAKHVPFYTRAKQYVDGEAPEHFASAVFARLLKGSANRFRMNYARVPVSALCNRMKISSFGVVSDEPATEFLKAVWKANTMENLYKEVHFKAASAGSAYLLAWPDPEDETGQSVDISMCSPETTRVFYSPENPRKALFASRTWMEGKRTRVNLYYRDRIEKYISKNKSNGKNAAMYEPYYDLFEEIDTEDGGTEVTPLWPLPNPFNRIPVFHFRVSDGYGRPVNKDAWEPQDAINKLTSTMMATVDYTGFPQRYVIENPASDGSDGQVDEFDDVAVPVNGGITDDEDGGNEKLKAGPGGLWFLTAKEVGQFDAADSDAFLKPTEQYIKAISTTTETPLHAFHGMGDAPSGESLRAANSPLNDNVQDIEGWFEPTWIELMDFLLDCGGFEDHEATMVWANPEKADDKEFWESVKVKISVGVPAYAALEEAGYDPDKIKAWGLVPELDPEGVSLEVETEETLADKFNALGMAIRAGVEPSSAAESVGLKGLKFTGAVPTTLRIPEVDAAALEEA